MRVDSFEDWLATKPNLGTPVEVGEDLLNRIRFASDLIPKDGSTPFGPALSYRDARGNLKVVPISKRITIGRRPADVVIADSRLSRPHFMVEPKGDGAWLKDLDSTNGISVNGHPIKEGALVVGDLIEAGNHLFLFLSR